MLVSCFRSNQLGLCCPHYSLLSPLMCKGNKKPHLQWIFLICQHRTCHLLTLVWHPWDGSPCAAALSQRGEGRETSVFSPSPCPKPTQRHKKERSLVHSFLPSLAAYLKVLLPFSLSFGFLLCLYFLFPLPLPGRETTKKFWTHNICFKETQNYFQNTLGSSSDFLADESASQIRRDKYTPLR